MGKALQEAPEVDLGPETVELELFTDPHGDQIQPVGDLLWKLARASNSL
jgi:hypothetical protein